MNPHVKQKVRAYLKTFSAKDEQTQQSDINAAADRLKLYERNAHGQEALYQKAGLIYNRYLRKMNTKKIEHKERAHALLSASGATRWLNCTPSPRLEEGFKNESSSFAEEGTLAHEVAELVLKRSLERYEEDEYDKQFDKCAENKYFTYEMLDFVGIHVDYVMEQFEAAKREDKHAVLLIEERVDITHLIEEGFGTCDDIIIANGVMEVIDLKFGIGVKVSAEDNAQLKLYALGALEKYDIKYDIHTVVLTITQPRMDSISSWSIDADELIKWGQETVKPTALIAYEGAGEQKTGDWCKFCRASPKCAAQHALALEAAQDAFTDPQLLNDEQLVEVYAKIDAVSKWFKSVSDYMYGEAMSGKKWDGYKLVDGQNRRAWADEEKAKDLLEGNYKIEQFSNTKLKGIGDIEKLVGVKNFPIIFGEVVEQKRTSPALVPETDKRPAMQKDDYFENLDEEI